MLIFMKTPAQNQMDNQIESLVKQIEDRGIECRKQSTYFGDEVCVHLYGNNERAAIYPASMFVDWAEAYLSRPEGYFDVDEEDEEEIYDSRI